MNNTRHISNGFPNSTFPFFIKIDENGKVSDAGESLLRLLPNINGQNLDDIISVKRPQNLSSKYADLKNHLQKLVFCELKLPTGNCFYKGQVIELKDEKKLCFLCTIFLNDPNDLIKHGIALNDFSISDSSADLLQVLQVNRMVTGDLEKLNSILQEKEKKYSEIIEHANEIIFTTDINGRFTYMNEIGINFIQLKDEVTELKFSDLIEPAHVQKIMRIGTQLIKKEIEVGYVEFQLKGAKKWIGQNITLLSNENGYGFQGIGRDITEKRIYEDLILQALPRSGAFFLQSQCRAAPRVARWLIALHPRADGRCRHRCYADSRDGRARGNPLRPSRHRVVPRTRTRTPHRHGLA